MKKRWKLQNFLINLTYSQYLSGFELKSQIYRKRREESKVDHVWHKRQKSTFPPMAKARDRDDLKRWAFSIHVTSLSLSISFLIARRIFLFPFFARTSTLFPYRFVSFSFLLFFCLSPVYCSWNGLQHISKARGSPFLSNPLFEGHISFVRAPRGTNKEIL